MDALASLALCPRLTPTPMQAQVMPVKEAKSRFRDSSFEFSEKRMLTTMPVIFFETMEIAWLPFKQIREWPEGLKHAAHLKQRASKRFRAGLDQVFDFFCSSKAPPKWVCKAPAPLSKAALAADPAPPVPATPRRAAPAEQSPAKPRARSAPTAGPHAERIVSEQERARAAILGGVSRDERHRRRLEATGGAPEDSPAEAPRPSRPKPAPAAAKGKAVETSTATESKDVGTSGGADSGTEADASWRPGKRHTRAKGPAELSQQDVESLEGRKVPPKRACTPGTATVTASASVGHKGAATPAAAPSEHESKPAASAEAPGRESADAAATPASPAEQRSSSGPRAAGGRATADSAPVSASTVDNTVRRRKHGKDAQPASSSAVGTVTAAAGSDAAAAKADAAASTAAASGDAPAAAAAAADSGAAPAGKGAAEEVSDGDEGGRGMQRRSRRDAPGRRSALELVSGVPGKDDSKRKASEARSRPASAARCVPTRASDAATEPHHLRVLTAGCIAGRQSGEARRRRMAAPCRQRTVRRLRRRPAVLSAARAQ